MNAFIIGNGFDIAHGMPTRYTDFRKYLINRFGDLKHNSLYFPEVSHMPDGDMYVNSGEVSDLLCYLMSEICGDDWQDFEKELGEIDLLECFSDLEEVYDRDGDRNLWHEAYNNEDRTAALSIVMPQVKVLFSEWIDSIETANQKIDAFSKIINPETDLFITFNYTHTLEDVYKCKNVTHMHGEIGGEIIVGHNGNSDYSEDNPRVPNGCFNTLQKIYDSMRKDTASVIKKHYHELKQIVNCSSVYSFGFSYSNVDMVYIETICKLLRNKKVVWYNNKFDNDKIPAFEELIRKCGFTGTFSTY